MAKNALHSCSERAKVYHPKHFDMLKSDARGVTIPPEEAWRRIAAELPRFADLPRIVAGRRAALGRTLAAELTATVDVPAADVSAMDGFAYAGDRAVGTRLAILGTIRAGDAPTPTERSDLDPNSASGWKIMTGAPLPHAADRVVPVEQLVFEDGFVELRHVAAPGDHIRHRGEVVRVGSPLLGAGTLLTPGALALLATHGFAEVAVVRPPRVAILTTGDEVVPPERTPAPGQLRDSHTDFLLAATKTLGIEALPLGIAADRKEDLREGISRGLESDVLLLCGGVSAGEFDFVEEVLTEFGCISRFDAVAIQPGKPLVFAVAPARTNGRPTLIFGLPGNPASVMVSFWLFVRPTLRRLLGSTDAFWHGTVRGTLAAPLPAAPPRDRILPAEIEFRAEGLFVHPLAVKGSHDLSAFARGTALLRLRVGAGPLAAGQQCEVLPLADWRGISDLSLPR